MRVLRANARESSELGRVAARFEDWRSSKRNARGRIPEYLWQEALGLVSSYGEETVAKTLGLNIASLKKKVNGPKSRSEQSAIPLSLNPLFVPVGLERQGTSVPKPGWQVEWETPRGTLRILGVQSSELETITAALMPEPSCFK